MDGFRHLISLIPNHSEQVWSLYFFQNQAIIDSLTFTKKTTQNNYIDARGI